MMTKKRAVGTFLLLLFLGGALLWLAQVFHKGTPSSVSIPASEPVATMPSEHTSPTTDPEHATQPQVFENGNVLLCEQSGTCPETFDAVVSDGCAPWDGPALDIFVRYDKKVLHINLYSKESIASFEAGKDVVVEPVSDGNTNTNLESGNTTLCNISGDAMSQCDRFAPGQAEIHNPSGVFDRSAPSNRLDIILQGKRIQVDAKWKESAELCG